MPPLIYIKNTNKWITSNYDTQPDKNEKEDVSVPIHQVQILNNSEYQKRKRKWYSQWIYIYISFINEGLYRQMYAMLIFMLIKSIPEDYLQNDDDVSCVTGVTGITGPSFISQDRRSDLP